MKAFQTISCVLLAATLATAHVEFLSNDPALASKERAEVAKSKENIRKNNKRFKKGKATELEASNEYMDLSSEEFEKEREGLTMPEEIPAATARAFGGLIPENPADRYDAESEAYLARLRSNRATPPSSYDARDHGLVTPVKNQQQCGSCAAFSATSAMESCILKARGNNNLPMPDLSEQFMVDCGYNGNSMNGCNGAWIHGYQDYIANNHNELPHEYNDLYRNTDPVLECDPTIPLFHAGAKVNGRVFTYSCSEADLKNLIMQHGAVSTAVYASDDTFKNYASGIISTCSSTSVNHAVTAIGWDDAQDVWIVKNSWGTGWGEGGYFRMKKGVCGVGTICATVTCSPDTVVDDPPTTTPVPASKKCDISSLYGNAGITGRYKLTSNMSGTIYTALVECNSSVCQPVDESIEDACTYICGRPVC